MDVTEKVLGANGNGGLYYVARLHKQQHAVARGADTLNLIALTPNDKAAIRAVKNQDGLTWLELDAKLGVALRPAVCASARLPRVILRRVERRLGVLLECLAKGDR